MFKIIFAFCCTFFVSISVCLADSKSNSNSNSDHKRQVLQTIKKLEQTQQKLAKDFNRLSAAAKAEIIQKTSGKTDSDGDSLNDFLEGALNLNKCNADSDDDGVDDGSEYEQGDDPKDDDSDDDGIQDGLEFEVRGTIQSITAGSLTVAGLVYVLTDSTQYLGDKKQGLSISDFSVGECIEFEGHNQGASKIVNKVKEEDSCN